MASFYAELQVAGTTYPVRSCAYEFTQSTNERGRVAAKVRHGLVRLTLDVPDGDELLSWAAAPFRPLAGRVIFRSAQGGAALETLSWEDGQCVGYQEEFLSGSVHEGAYVCHLTIAAPKLTMAPGGPASYVSPAAGEHGSPQQALMNPFLVPLLAPPPVISPLVVPVAEDLAAVAARLALEGVVVAAAPVALILALILGTATSAGGPGIPQPHFPLVSPDELRLHELEARLASGTLAPAEESELIALLAKVKGIRVGSLADLNVTGRYKKQPQALPGFHFEEITYTKRTKADTEVLRRKFGSSVRGKFMKKISTDPAYVSQLRAAGFVDDDLTLMQSGRVPDDWEVHHKLPLDDGGDNSFDNLLLIKSSPYHSVVTGYQKTYTGKLKLGESTQIKWPTYNQGIVYPPKKP